MRTVSDRSRRPASERHVWQRHTLVVLLILGVTAVCLAFIAYANWKQQADARAIARATTQDNARIDERVKATLKRRLKSEPTMQKKPKPTRRQKLLP